MYNTHEDTYHIYTQEKNIEYYEAEQEELIEDTN